MPRPVSSSASGREFFKTMLDGLIADKIEKGIPPSSPGEAKQMDEARRLSRNVMEMLRPLRAATH